MAQTASSSLAPAPAAAVGYSRQTYGPLVTLGQNIYPMAFWSNDPTKSGATQSGGNIVISGAGGNNSYNGQILTANGRSGQTAWTGAAFGGGGYFEASISFAGAPATTGGWPSFWMSNLEALLPAASSHETDNVEVDQMEFDTQWAGVSYGTALHDWHTDGSQTPSNNKPVPIPAGTNLSQPHRYGVLWMPATATSQGYMKWYFDGQQVSTTDTWNLFNPAQSPSQNPFAVVDTTHLVPIFGTGPNNPMTIYNLSVWQASTANDIFQGVATPPPPPTPTPDTLTLRMSEDAYQGDAQFTVSVNGQRVGGTMTASALHSSGDANVFQLTGSWSANAQVQIAFINDAWGGTSGTDRNLYMNSLSYDGKTYGSASLYANSTVTVPVGGASTAASPIDVLTVHLSEDAYQGDADFKLLIDGQAVTTPQPVTALHTAGAWQNFTFAGNFGAGTHSIGVVFTNDAYGGTASTDRNLYVNGVDIGGTHYGNGVRSLLSTESTATYTISTLS